VKVDAMKLKIMGKTNRLVLGSGFVLLLLYLLFWPVPINPDSWTPPDLPPLTGVYQKNNRLAVVEKLGIGAGIGPEDIAFDSQGYIYSGVADGNIFRFRPDGTQPEIFVNTGGRPLGLAFDARGFLIVADAFKGLLAVAPDGSIQVLANQVDGERINFVGGIDVASDGTIYFSEA
jgi:sugar lactone lactonase YvrE